MKKEFNTIKDTLASSLAELSALADNFSKLQDKHAQGFFKPAVSDKKQNTKKEELKP